MLYRRVTKSEQFYAEKHAKALQTINVVFLVLVPLCCVLSIYAPEGGSFVPVFLFIGAILICILSYIIFIFRPVHCQTPGCNGRMEKWVKPISAFKVELEYRCPICESVYVREIFQPQGDYK